ncbi:hypothetical protein GCM10017576_07460 [Microbacterium barkeri]|uniref:Uncharacterized protein n=1 Tax=Microbacterium barkeri TaxID=33917 RepID=A0A9W6H161_9MICO|nr:hypothetical protein GCM10017576_07460 [Microbacterium barkeri]
MPHGSDSGDGAGCGRHLLRDADSDGWGVCARVVRRRRLVPHGSDSGDGLVPHGSDSGDGVRRTA